MSERNVELHRRATETFNTHDLETLIALSDPSIEIQPMFVAAVGGVTVYRGHDGVRSWLRDFEEVFGDEIRSDPEAYFDLGEYTLLFLVAHGRGKQSGAEVAMPVAAVARWRNGLCVYFKGYDQRGDALRDLGVTEDALDPIAP